MTRERIPITREGLEALRQEYEYLVKHRRPEIARIIQEAREHGDIRENAAYDAAKHDQAFIEDASARSRNSSSASNSSKSQRMVIVRSCASVRR